MYVFDTSSLIGAWCRLYPPDLFPALWEQMDALAADGRLIAPEDILNELKVGDDDLYQWVKQRSDAIVVPTSRAIMLEARAVLADQPFLTKTGTGRNKADPFVIALASLRGCPLVTQEAGGTATKPRIPYVCESRGIACLQFINVIRSERWSF